MARIEDYAVIGNSETMALVCRNASIDWLCLPRFDSDACFAALLGDSGNGHWQIAPAVGDAASERHYRDGSLVLETEFKTAEGHVKVIDCMHAYEEDRIDVLRLVRGIEGNVPMHLNLSLRFGYGRVVPWVTRIGAGRLQAIAGPDRVIVDTPVELRGEDLTTKADFDVAEGQEIPFSLTWTPSWQQTAPPVPDVAALVEQETHEGESWSRHCREAGPWTDAVRRSLVTLKALTHRKTGGIVAAGTTSLPEQLGGVRNWDYRYCWLRDATLTLFALIEAGYTAEAGSWREWLLRAVAGDPKQLRIMYGLAGERRLSEYELDWLPGYESSAPVRVGNAASDQLQLDVYGEVMDALHNGRRHGLAEEAAGWSLQCMLTQHLETIWQQPDEGIWEIRGPRRQFTYSKLMVWVALDRMISSAEQFDLKGPVAHWREVRKQVHDDICEHAFNPKLGSFMQYYGAETELDASLLHIPLVGFLPVEDERVRGTIHAIEKHLTQDGFVRRYDTGSAVDGVAGDEGVFLACSFWLVDCMTLQGRLDDARTLFERLLALRNDVGLLSEEYEVSGKRQVGNFPQAFSHIALVNAAYNLSEALWPVEHRCKGKHRHQ